MIIDCHTHLNNYNLNEGDPSLNNCERLFSEMNEFGVDHSVVITSYTINCDRPSVQEILMVLAENPRTTIIEGLRWRSTHRSDLFTMENRLIKGIIKGIKLYPGYEPYAITDPSLESVYRLAAKYNVPVMIHTGDTYSKKSKVRNAHPLLVDDVAVDYPDVNFIMCHAGNPWFIDAGEVLYKNDNVFADISGLTLGKFSGPYGEFLLSKLKEMITYLGNSWSKILYGSDWPLVDMATYLDFMESLEVPLDQRESLIWKNSAKLFSIDVNATIEAVKIAPDFKERKVV